MGLEIQQRVNEGIKVLDLRGSLVIGPSEATLRQAMIVLASAGVVKAILNCALVTQIDEDGLGALVLCAAKVRKGGGELKLLNIQRDHVALILLTRLAATFEIFKDEQDAVDSFFPDRVALKYDILEFVEKEEEERSSSEPKS